MISSFQINLRLLNIKLINTALSLPSLISGDRDETKNMEGKEYEIRNMECHGESGILSFFSFS